MTERRGKGENSIYFEHAGRLPSLGQAPQLPRPVARRGLSRLRA